MFVMLFTAINLPGKYILFHGIIFNKMVVLPNTILIIVLSRFNDKWT